MNVHSAPSLARAGALVVALAGVSACAPGSSIAPSASQQASAAPVLLSCPTGQQPLLRQVLVNGAPVSQVECVAASAAMPGTGVTAPVPMAPAPLAYATAPTPMVPMGASLAPAAPYVVPSAQDRGGYAAPPPARRVVYADDVVEYRPAKKGRSVKKSLLIIGSSAGVGAGVGAATGGKKGALIGAAIGGGAATVWDQVTRR